MREIKDSGYSWVGTIPTTWAMKKGKYLFVQRSTKGNKITLQLLSPTQRFGVIPQEMYEELTGMNAVKLNENVDLSLMKTIHKGDFCISLRSFQGGFEYSKYEGVVSPAYQVFYPIVSIANGYYKYLFKDIGFIEKMNSYTMTLRDGKNIAFADFGNTYIPYPPLSEQQRIADFLDGKCAEIDGLVADIQSQIDTLEQYKRSVITETVTKGLNPDAEMKDSGIDFIGDIPIMWQVLRMKNLGTYRNGLTYSPSDLCDETNGTLVLRSSNIQDGKLCFSNNVYVSASIPQTLRVQEDDILICSRNGSQKLVGKNAIISNNVSASFGAFMMVFRCNRNILPKYAYYLLNSQVFSYYLATFFTSTINQLTGQNFGNMKIPFCPDIQCQRDIANYLDNKCTEIDTIIDPKKEQLAVLENYKKSLIYEYVTGKKEVPAPMTTVMIDPNVILLGKLPKLLSKQKGKIYNQKVLYLLNTYLGLNLSVQYYRYKHGPYDVMLDSYIETLVKNGWCTRNIHNGAENLEVGPNYVMFEEKYSSHFSEYDAEIEKLINFVQPMKRSQLERVATLFAVWNDMILDGKSAPTDAEIISEVMSGWTENKANFSYDTWLDTLNKMRKQGVVPTGRGLHTLPKSREV